MITFVPSDTVCLATFNAIASLSYKNQSPYTTHTQYAAKQHKSFRYIAIAIPMFTGPYN